MSNLNIEYENLYKVNSSFHYELQQRFEKFLQDGNYILGKEVAHFEQLFANYCGIKNCIGVASGLDAITLSIKTLRLEEGSEIIVASNTYIATIFGIIHAGMIPVLVEPDIHTYNLNPALIEDKITNRTKAIMTVHLYGKICDMAPIIEIAEKNNLFVIEDAAQAHGATYKGKKAGSFGHINAFSFYPTKNLGALGDAGAITTQSDEFSQVVFSLRNYGRTKSNPGLNEWVGHNSRMDELQAAFLSVKLKALDSINEHKRNLANIYLNKLKKDFILPVVHKDYQDAYHIFNIRHSRREEVIQHLKEHGIETRIHYPVPPHKQEALKGYWKEEFLVSEEIHNTTISLPISYSHSKTDIENVVEVLNKF